MLNFIYRVSNSSENYNSEETFNTLSRILPITEEVSNLKKQLKLKTKLDPTLSMIIKYLPLGWPHKKIFLENFNPFYITNNAISIEEDIFVFEDNIIILN